MENCFKVTDWIFFKKIMVWKVGLKLRNGYRLRRPWYGKLC